MPCYFCHTTEGSFQKLEVARLRFIRKVHPKFKDNSVLCLRCFKQFEKIYKMKKSQNSMTQTTQSSSSVSNSVRSYSTSDNSSQNRSNVTTVRNKNNTNIDSSESLQIPFAAPSDNSSIDSVDRIVQMVPNHPPVSSRIQYRNPEMSIERQKGERALKSVLRRKRIQQTNDPAATPTRPSRSPLIGDKDGSSDEDDIHSQFNPNDLIHVRPIVKRRREKVVHQNEDIMAIYVAGTSGG